MKKIIIIILAVVTFSLFTTCQKDKTPAETNLSVSFTQQPSGGAQVNTVSVRFAGTISGNVQPVAVTVEWWWEDGYHSNAKLKSSAEYTFNSSSTTTKSNFPTYLWKCFNYILLNYYWVKISWTDDSGSHLIESSKAYCTQ